MRAVSAEDGGVHFDKIQICREWGYFSAVFNENSDWGRAGIYKSAHKASVKEHINYWKNDSYVVSERSMSETWRNSWP